MVARWLPALTMWMNRVTVWPTATFPKLTRLGAANLLTGASALPEMLTMAEVPQRERRQRPRTSHKGQPTSRSASAPDPVTGSLLRTAMPPPGSRHIRNNL